VDLALLAQAHCEGHHEEGQPADDEGAGDDGQCLGGLPLPLGLQELSPLGQFLVRIGDAGQHSAQAHSGVLSGTGALCSGRLPVTSVSASCPHLFRGRGRRQAASTSHGDGLGQRRYGVQMRGYQMVLRGMGHLLRQRDDFIRVAGAVLGG